MSMPPDQTRPGRRTAEDEDAPAPSLLGNIDLTDPQVRALRVAVIVMGVLIVMGLIAVIGRIVYLMARPSAPAIAASGRLAPEVSASLPAGSHVKTVTLLGDRVAIHYEGPSGAGIVVIDLATAKTISRIKVVPEAPAQ